MFRFTLGVVAGATLAFGGGAATAGEETLSFRLVTTNVASLSHDDPAIEGLQIEASKAVGVAVFEDGRLAYKEYIALSYASDPPTMSPGFSSYVFENGDSLQVSFTAGPSDGGFVVNYTVLSGTGAYEGATGTGKISAAASSWNQATLFVGSIDVTTP